MTHASIFSRLLIKCIRSMFTPRFFFSLFLLSPSTFITQSSSLQDENSSIVCLPPSYVPFQIYLLRLSKISLSRAATHPEVGSGGAPNPEGCVPSAEHFRNPTRAVRSRCWRSPGWIGGRRSPHSVWEKSKHNQNHSISISKHCKT